jgi:hypothetical protein
VLIAALTPSLCLLLRGYASLSFEIRSCLGFKTPYQVFFERTGIDARQLGVVRL